MNNGVKLTRYISNMDLGNIQLREEKLYRFKTVIGN